MPKPNQIRMANARYWRSRRTFAAVRNICPMPPVWRWSRGRDSGTASATKSDDAAAKMARPKKMARQPPSARSAVPPRGPMMGPILTSMPKIVKGRTAASPVVRSATTARPPTSPADALRPINRHRTMSTPASAANPATVLATAMSIPPPTITTLRPMRSVSAPRKNCPVAMPRVNMVSVKPM